MTQPRLAQLAGVGVSTIKRAEHGRPVRRSAPAIADALLRPERHLFDEAGRPLPGPDQ